MLAHRSFVAGTRQQKRRCPMASTMLGRQRKGTGLRRHLCRNAFWLHACGVPRCQGVRLCWRDWPVRCRGHARLRRFFLLHAPFLDDPRSQCMAVLSRPDSKAVAQRLHKSRALRQRGRQAKSTAHCSGRSWRRLASGGRTMARSSARRSLSSSAAPSTLAALARGRDMAATALAAAKDRSADQRDT